MASFEDSLNSCKTAIPELSVPEDVKSLLQLSLSRLREYHGMEEALSTERQNQYVSQKLEVFQHKYLKEATRAETLEQQLNIFKGQVEGLVKEQLRLAEDNHRLTDALHNSAGLGENTDDIEAELAEARQETGKLKHVCSTLSLQVRSLIVKASGPDGKKSKDCIQELQNQNEQLIAHCKEIMLKAEQEKRELTRFYLQKLDAAERKSVRLEAEKDFASSVLVQNYSGVPYSKVAVLESLFGDKEEELKIVQTVNLRLEDEVTWHKRKVESLEASIDLLKFETKSLKETLDSVEASKEKLQKVLDGLEEQLILVTKRRNLVEQLDEKRRLVSQLEERTNEVKALSSSYQSTVKQLELSQNLASELGQALQKANEEQQKSAELANIQILGELEGLRLELAKVKKARKKDMANFLTEKTALQEEVARLQATASIHEKCQEQFEAHKKRQLTSVASMKNKYDKQLAEANQTIASLTQNLENAVGNANVEALTQQIEELNEQIEEITEENLNLHRLAESTNPPALLQEASKELAEKQAELELAQSQLLTSKAEASKLSIELETLQAVVAQKSAEIEESSELKQLQAHVANLESELAELREVRTELQETKLKQESLDKKYNERIAQARNVIKEKHESLQKMKLEVERLKGLVLAPEGVGKLVSVLQKMVQAGLIA